MRRRLLVLSTPVAILLIVTLVKLWSVVVAGGAVPSDFAARDTAALRGDVDALSVFNVIEPERAPFAAGALAVLEDRLPDADTQFAVALAHSDPGRSCPVRINLELVRETLGDRAANAMHPDVAVARYRDALKVVAEAPAGCFAGSTDPDPQRRAVLDSAAPRLDAKITALEPFASPPPAPRQAPPPPPPAPSPAGATTAPERERRLNPGAGDPLDRLKQILRDATPVPSNDQ